MTLFDSPPVSDSWNWKACIFLAMGRTRHSCGANLGCSGLDASGPTVGSAPDVKNES